MKVAVITASDRSSKGEREDISGQVIQEVLAPLKPEIAVYKVVPDDLYALEAALREAAETCQLVVTTGGTGIGPRDVTPEATRRVIDKELPGFGEIMRMQTYAKTKKSILSRATAGTTGGTLIINLPGTPKGVRECLELLLDAIPHAVKLINQAPDECG